MYPSEEQELRDIMNSAEFQTGLRITALITRGRTELRAEEKHEEPTEDYDNSLIQGWRWV